MRWKGLLLLAVLATLPMVPDSTAQESGGLFTYIYTVKE